MFFFEDPHSNWHDLFNYLIVIVIVVVTRAWISGAEISGAEKVQ